ncbi:MAG: hypothetical protein CL946_06585 [Ectothiorhodospiraceae bacterium]|nr:hypothetical protein [Ectothiorhodospiraceae bacterium]
MTLTDLYTYLDASLDAYAAGGAGWQIASGVRRAKSYEELEDFNTPGRMIYGWIGSGERIDGSDSPATFECEAVLYARGRIVGESSTLDSESCKMLDDLTRMLVADAGSLEGTVEMHSFTEPVIVGNRADVFAQAVCTFARRLV